MPCYIRSLQGNYIIYKVCLEVTDPIKMYVIIKAVSIDLKINIITKSENVWQKLLVGNQGISLILSDRVTDSQLPC